MQFSHFVSLLKESKPKFFRYWKFFSFLIPILLLVVIARRNEISLQWVSMHWDFTQYMMLIVVLLLMPINWGLEAYKWYYLMRRFGLHISFLSSFKTTLTGLSYSLVLPGGIGEYLGRAEAIPKGEAWKGAGVLSVARIAQLYATLLFGGISLSVYLWDRAYYTWFIVFVSFVVLCWSVFIFSKFLAHGLELKLGQQYTFVSDLLDPWLRKGSDKLWVFLVSTLRYVVFSFQFYLVLLVFGVKGSVSQLFSGIASAFLFKSFFPSFLDLGPRELAVTLFFKDMGVTMAQVLEASLCVWMINVMLPGIAGALLLFRNAILNRKKW